MRLQDVPETQNTNPKPGDRATCIDCGAQIVFVGPYWDHIGQVKPRHIARPGRYVYAVVPEPASPTPEAKPVEPVAESVMDWTPGAKALREELAAYAHEAWSGWMSWMFQFCTEAPGGGLTISPEKVARWTRQMVTPYDKLPVAERQSDIAEAEKMMAILFKCGYKLIED